MSVDLIIPRLLKCDYPKFLYRRRLTPDPAPFQREGQGRQGRTSPLVAQIVFWNGRREFGLAVRCGNARPPPR